MSCQVKDSVQVEGGISLFSKPSKKRRKKSGAAAPPAITYVPPTASTAASTDGPQAGTAEAAGVESAAAQRQAPAGISGRAEADERSQGFRSLGVSEWLDRCVSGKEQACPPLSRFSHWPNQQLIVARLTRLPQGCLQDKARRVSTEYLLSDSLQNACASAHAQSMPLTGDEGAHASAARLHPRHTGRPRRAGDCAHGQRQDSGLCAAHPAGVSRGAFRRVRARADAHQARAARLFASVPCTLSPGSQSWARIGSWSCVPSQEENLPWYLATYGKLASMSCSA